MIQVDFSTFPVLNTENFVLRKLSMKDANEIYQLRSDDEINKYLARAKATSMEDAVKYIEKIDAITQKNDGLVWTICYKNSDTLIGTVCIFNINVEHASAEIGFELLPEFHGKGVMQEVLPATINFACNELHIQRIEGIVAKGNIRSMRLLEKNNFKKTDIVIPEEPDVFVYELLQ